MVQKKKKGGKGVENGIDDNDQNISLIDAVKNQDIERVNILINKGANVNLKDFNGRTPLHIASILGNVNIVKSLLAKDAIDVNAVDNLEAYQQTALHLATINGYCDIVELLLTAPEVNVNAKNRFKQTPLHLAVIEPEKEKCVEALLAAPGIDVNAKDRGEMTPLFYAETYKNEVYSDLIKKKQEDIQTGGKKYTTKQYTIYNGKKYVLRIGQKGGKYILVGTDKKKIYI